MDKSDASNTVSQDIKLLIVDDDEVTRNLLQEVFAKDNYKITLAPSGEAALKILEKQNFSLILSDIRMLEVDGMEILAYIKKKSPDSIVILMTGFGNLDGAVKAIKEGAYDYISKPFKMVDLKLLVHRAVKQLRSMRESSLGVRIESQGHSKMLIGKTPQIVEVYKNLAKASLSTSSVLIQGESGTGKELVAKAIHENSVRKSNPFLTITCGTRSEGLLDEELFGSSGAFHKSEHGSIFLDEIDEISSALQIKLLRVLQENEYKPVGSNNFVSLDVRIIAATDRNLEQMVRDGKFREDLYYRLKVIEIHLPALRERLDDLPELVSHFISYHAQKNKKNISHVSDEAMELLSKYSWPGNVRELEHAIERAVALSNATVLFPEDFSLIREQALPSLQTAHLNSENEKKSLDDVEREHILKVLKDVQYNKSKASEVLGIDRATLYRKAQKFGIELKGDK